MCREHVGDVRDDYSRFVDAGGEVAVITMGTTEQTTAFREQHRLPFLCLADPDRTAYEAYRVPRGTASQVAGPSVWAGGLKALVRAGFGRPVGDVSQLHGAFVIDTAGIVRYAHLPRHTADLPSNDELIAELEAL